MRKSVVLLFAIILSAGRLAGQCDVVITNPAPVCSPATVDLTDPAVTAGSTPLLTFSYWLDELATNPYNTPKKATAGTYYIKGDNGAGCTQVKPVVVTVTIPPTASISYAGTPFCKALTSPQPVTLTGTGAYTGGTFSASASLTLNSSSGAITPSTSSVGTYTVTYTTPASGGCSSVIATTSVTIVGIPTAPVVGTITQPTCNISTGSVALSGLPNFGDWTVTATPGGSSINGMGTTAVFSGLAANTTYTFRVTNYAGCISPSSGNAAILPQPSTPTAPVVGTITVPTCAVPTGSVFLSGLPASGSWTVIRYPGNVSTTGSGTSTTITGIPSGTYFFTVTNAAGCTSGNSTDAVIPAPPGLPAAPVIGTITHPTCTVSTGSVVLNGLPASGTWTLTINPGGGTRTGTGTTGTFSGITPGTYTFTVTNSIGCTSVASAPATINAQPATPTAPVVGTITQPTCALSTGSVVLSGLPGGSWVLTRTPGGVTTNGSGSSATVSGIDPGTYTFTVANSSGCVSPSSGNVVINQPPPSPPAPVVGVNCDLGFNHAVITVTSPLGAGYTYSLDGGGYQVSPIFSNVANGNHIIAVRNLEGCTTVGTIFAVSCGCINAPAVTLSATSGSTCGLIPVTIENNTFSGSATSVTITENGAGSVSPPSSSTSPFSFTYTPAAGDRNRTVIITVTTNNPLGSPCNAAVATYTLAVSAVPTAPVIGTITNLSCTITTGSIVLNGLPSTGTWTLTMMPDNVITSGTGSSTTVTDLQAGTYTFIVANEDGCLSPESAPATINPQPSSPTAPVIGAIVHPTCATSTGSVGLSGLPESGTWTITRLPGGATRTGTGATFTVTTVPPGTYTYTVTNSTGCSSPPSEEFTINEQPLTPTAPIIGTITAPTCTLATGSVVLLSLPASGEWTLTRYPGAVTVKGTGTSTTIEGLPSGTYNFTVANQALCVSIPSANAIIPAQPVTPAAPVVGTITQPTLAVPTGSVILSGLPAGSWMLNRIPDEVTTAGSGTSFTVTGLPGGLFNFTVRNTSGCVSDTSADVVISTPGKPMLIITDPPAACSPGTVDLTDPSIKEGSTTGLIYTYWTDAEATVEYATPATATEGTYYIKGTTVSGFFDIQPVNVTIDEMPVANGGSDQVLSYVFSTTMEALLGDGERGVWKIESGTGVIADTLDPVTEISNLSSGNNMFLWIVTKGVCPADTDKVAVVVGDLTIPTLITPNGDTKNEYFVIMGLETLGKTELVVFDRRGAEVFRDDDYKNKWNGIDYNENPLPNDTYFFHLQSAKGRSVSGYIVIRR